MRRRSRCKGLSRQQSKWTLRPAVRCILYILVVFTHYCYGALQSFACRHHIESYAAFVVVQLYDDLSYRLT